MEGSKVEVSEVGEMMTEVSKVITSHLHKLVNKFEEDKKNMVSTVEILKKLPIIKELEDKLKIAEEENAKLRSKIKELLASSSQSKKITLQTEEINESDKPVSYSEIDALVETQVKNKENATKDEPNYNYSTYLANQSDTDTSDNESDASEIDTSEMYHVYDSRTLLGTWNTKETDSSKNKTSYDPKILELAKANYAKYYNKEKKDVTTKEIEDSSAGVEGWGEPMEFEVVEEELGPAELAKEAAQDEELVDTDEEIVAGESDDEVEEEEDVADEVDEEDGGDTEDGDEAEDDEDEEDEDDEQDEDEEDEDEAEEDEDEEDEDANEEEAEEDEDEELEVEEIKIEGKMYYCTGKENGVLFEYCEDGEIGEEIGHLEDGAVFFS